MKKSLVVIALIFATLCSLFVFSVSAAEQENIHISSTEFQVRQGEEFTTTIYIADNANIIDFEVLLKYDTEKLTLISATENEDIKGAVVINAETAGSIRINYSKTSDNVTKKTLLVDLTFRVDEYLPSSVYDCLTVDKSGAYVAHRLVNGLLEEVDFNCKFAPLNIYETGDVDLNHKVDIGDATYIRRHLAKLHTLTDFQLLFANTQSDNIIDIADAVALQRNLAKLEVDGYGDRINVLFCNTDGTVLTKKSAKIGADLKNIPDVPFISGYTNGRWSLSKTEYIVPDYTNLTSEMTVYAIYEKSDSPYIQYYISQVNSKINQYNGVIDRDLALDTEIFYDENRAYTGKIVWRSSDARVLSAEGVFQKQTYDKAITLTATITSYLADGVTKESSEILTFTLLAKGAYSTPTKSEIVKFLQTVTNGTLSGTSTITGGEIDCDLNLIRKISNNQVDSSSGSVYEVRVEWLLNNNGVYEPISQIQRGTSAKTIDLVATITFNGEPLEGDGKVYFDDISLTAITEDEVRRHVINEIATKVKNSFSTGDTLWAGDTTYSCEIKWISNDTSTVTIEQNSVIVNEQAINGSTCPITVQVTYPTDAGSNTFNLEYVITVVNPSNTLLRPGVNISESLYYALMIEMRDRFGYTQLTTEALKNTKFVSLDLSQYNDWFEDGAGELHAPITDLTGLTYCENLRLLNISGLNITSGISEIAGLIYLESFIANNVDISSEAVGGTPILDNMIGLKLVDLSHNDLTSLDMFFSSTNIYSKLKELYLDNNNLSDISLLSQTPMLTLLTLSNNNIESDDISVLAGKTYLTYLSLNNNNISDISSLNKLTALTELRLHCNNISNITALKNMTAMKKLYLGNNKIINIDSLAELMSLEVLYLNNNAGITDIYALSALTAMQILNLSNCSINQIVDLKNMIDLKELYAENNEIPDFTTLAIFTSMEKLLLAGNERSSKQIKWNEYIGNMSNLKVLTLSGLNVNNLSFLETTTNDSSTQATTTTTKPIERLEIANCALASTYTSGDTSIDNMAMLEKLKLTLKYLDISNNPIDANISNIGSLSSLELLYADNVDIGEDIIKVMESLSSMRYLSLENCNISNMYKNSNKPWLATSRKYVFIDLAQNPIETFNFDFVSNSVSTLKNLYLDTTDTNAALYLTVDYADNGLEGVSLEGYYIHNVDLIPDMPNIKTLNLRNTKLADFIGNADVNGEYPYSLGRFETLEYLDVSQSEVNIFTKANLEMLYANFADIYVNLYADSGEYAAPEGYSADGMLNAQKEGTKLLSVINNMVSEVKVATEGISDNNPELILDIAGYTVVWQVSDTLHYSVANGKLELINIANIKNDTLALTATIESIYGTANAASRKFDVNTDVLRLSNTYIASDSSGASNTLMRGDDFLYDFNVIANDTELFSSKVTPVNYTVTYTHSAVDAYGATIDVANVLEIVSEGEHHYKIKSDAPLGSKATITVNIQCADDATNDITTSIEIRVVAQTYSLTFVPNGGTVYNGNGAETTKLTQEEESELVYSQHRIGYTFDGWYIDPQFTTKFTATTMPSEDTEIYAKWIEHTYKVIYNGNGATSGSTPTSEHTYDISKTLTSNGFDRTGYSFDDWNTKPDGTGDTYDDNQSVKNLTDTNNGEVLLYAQWTKNTYTVTLNLNSSTIKKAPQSLSNYSYPVTYATSGQLPTPKATYYVFDGWFTASSGGTRITDANGNYSTWSIASNTPLYAHWKQESGYENYTYLTSSEFSKITQNPSGNYMLVEDVSLANLSYTTMGTFSGVLDGRGHTLSGWNYIQSGVGNYGLFGINKGTIRDLKLNNFSISTSDPSDAHGTAHGGLLCGINEGTITNVSVNNSSISIDLGSLEDNNSHYINVGGLCGYNTGTITDCSVNSSTITGYAGTKLQDASANIGGAVGCSQSGTIKKVYSTNNTITCTTKASSDKNWLGSCKAHGRPYAYVAGIIGKSSSNTILDLSSSMVSNNKITLTLDRDSCGCDTNKGSAYNAVYN